jgi:hypothetical protein
MTLNNHPLMTEQERRRLRDAKIRSLYNTKVGGKRVYSMDDVVAEMKKIGYGVSKRTVFLAVNWKKSNKALEKRKIRRQLKNNSQK